MTPFTLGIDYGTNSVRAVVVNCLTGEEIGTGVVNYPSGHQGILLDEQDPNLARQSPKDYLYGLERSVRDALEDAQKFDGFSADQVAGIGVDTTGSSPLPVDAKNRALGTLDQWEDNLNAQSWLWKDHTSHREATEITELAAEHRPEFIAKCGNTYSSEWWWSKILHCRRIDSAVSDAAHSWVELCDYIPSVLAGITDPSKIVRGVCAAGHKALYSEDWDGLPDKEFLAMLDPALADPRDRLYERAVDVSHSAGQLCPEWAAKLGLPEGIEIAVGEFDVHYGAIGCGVEEGTLVKVIGTSTCDCGVVSLEKDVPDIPGICGIVKGAILPGFYGIEAGQSAVGDLFKWWVEKACEGNEEDHRRLTEEVANQAPGASGLLALDWNNGNRTILVDQRLTGLLVGQTLHTTQAEIYRALIEATAFGARMIIERIVDYGVPIDRIVCAGGIAEKNAMLMQIYADVTGREMRVSGSSQTCALGAAVGASVNAGVHSDFASAQKAMTFLKDVVYTPNPESHAVYNQIFELYREVHDAFGGVKDQVDLGSLMKQLLLIKEAARS
ncbi:ribulokinase [Puniceicoccus vermicola]|uniref:Ribulokinase n=1 Tax=Puniceicoccus vermicola TaxID=388746 RepID=A0A7X1B337_9BACT|nr:ribulokinase [Puniceicoccus vermicola]MBC2603525.1 ribulokinase [Puniceicoccus vermicola]